MLPGFRSEVQVAKCIGCGHCMELCHRKAPIMMVSYQVTDNGIAQLFLFLSCEYFRIPFILLFFTFILIVYFN